MSAMDGELSHPGEAESVLGSTWMDGRPRGDPEVLG